MIGSSRTSRGKGLWIVPAAAGMLGILLSASCAPKVDTDAISQDLKQLDEEWSRAAGGRDAEAVASFYAENAVAYPPGAPVAVGRAAAKEVWASYFALPDFSISWSADRAGVSQSGDLGYTAGHYEDSYLGPDSTLVTEKGKFLCIWAKQADGSWKAVQDMWNSDS